MNSNTNKRIAFYGGSFDPVHNGHLEIARCLGEKFKLDEFSFVPAFHAPHKRENKPASPFHRFAMLSMVTDGEEDMSVSTIELDDPENPYTVQTLTQVTSENPSDEIFFVIGADSWQEITTWRSWEKVLTIVNIIVVTRPGYEIGFDHVTDRIRERVVDLRGRESEVRSQESDAEKTSQSPSFSPQSSQRIFITDSVFIDISATEIRKMVREGDGRWTAYVPDMAARHIDKYQLYR